MKNLLMLVSFVFVSFIGKAQITVGIQGTTNGVDFAVGGIAHSFDLQFGYNMTRQTEKPRIFTILLGKEISLSDRESKTNYTYITPSIGYGYYEKDILNADKSDIIGIDDKDVFAYKIEFGRDIHYGRFITTFNYTNKFYIGFGMRALIR